ncbi:MAG: glycosyltransferase family 4 protein [Chitinophagaceae bacterium]
MKIAFIVRSTLYTVPGGDTVQVIQLAKELRKLNVGIDIFLTNDPIEYKAYDLFHFFNIIRPADILFHVDRINKPFLISPILVDYSEYDSYHRHGIPGFILRQFSAGRREYIKTIFRWLSGKDVLRSKGYLWKGQQKSIKEIIEKSALLLPGSQKEYEKLKELSGRDRNYIVAPNGIDQTVFCPDKEIGKDNKLVVCAARIEGIKNQLNLIKALNNTSYTLILVGSPGPNHKNYYKQCKKTAAKNVQFYDHVPQDVLIDYYKVAKCMHCRAGLKHAGFLHSKRQPWDAILR